MNILELLDGVIRKPAAALRYIAGEKPAGWAMAIFTASALLGLISTDHSMFEQYINSPGPNIIVQLAAFLTGLFIAAGFLYLLSRIFKATGGFWGLFSALGFAQFPGFLVPLAELIKQNGGTAGAVLGGILSFGIALWIVILHIIALRESRGIGTGASILTYLIALVIFAVVIMIGAVCIVLVSGIFL
ncbi:MAG: YIP1 family protein [Firmicutes bacterium]|nr:YIP1 family protein [Bacillota bacterium]